MLGRQERDDVRRVRRRAEVRHEVAQVVLLPACRPRTVRQEDAYIASGKAANGVCMSIHASIPSREPSSARGGRSSAAITVPPEFSAAARGHREVLYWEWARVGSISSSALTMRRSCRFMRTVSQSLPLRDKILVWHLYLAALAGRDIYYDQRHALNLDIRDLLEAILRHGEQS